MTPGRSSTPTEYPPYRHSIITHIQAFHRPVRCVLHSILRALAIAPGISLHARGCPRPKWPKTPKFHAFPPVGVRSAKTENVKKLRATILESVVTFFPVSGALALGNSAFFFFVQVYGQYALKLKARVKP